MTFLSLIHRRIKTIHQKKPTDAAAASEDAAAAAASETNAAAASEITVCLAAAAGVMTAIGDEKRRGFNKTRFNDKGQFPAINQQSK